MKEILKSYEDMMLFRLGADSELSDKTLHDMLEAWYRLRRMTEEGGT